MLDSVKIIHDRLTGGDYRFLSDFFRFVGVYVCDCVMEESQTTTEYSAVIIIKKNIMEKDFENLKKNYPNAILWETVDLESRKTNLENLIEQIIRQNNSDNRTEEEQSIEDLKEAARIYVSCNLMKERNSYAYFYTNEEILKQTKEVFLDAYENVTRYIIEKQEVSRYFFFFRMDIIRCVNEICRFLREIEFFDTKAVLNCIQSNLAKYSNCSNFYILMGMICELDIQYQTEAERYYKTAIESIGTKAYGSFCCYKLARYYEKIEENWEKAIIFYQKAAELNENSYRVLYKLGMYRERKRQGQRALENYKRICEILKKQEEQNYLQEKEYEYLYKTYFRIGEISKNTGQYAEATQSYRRMELLYEKMNRKNEFYQEVYGDEEKFRGYTKKRLGLSQVYERLIDIYKNTGEEAKISEAMKKIAEQQKEG